MDHNAPKLYTAKLTGRRTVAEGTPELTFRLDDTSFSFTPGQYIWLLLPALNTPDPQGQRRAFSIASAPAKLPEISIVYRSGQSGFKQTLENLPIGAEVKIWGAYGSFLPDTVKPLVFIAGGVAVAPFISILEDAFDGGRQLNAVLVTANSSAESLPYAGRLPELTQKTGVKFVTLTGKINWENLGSHLPDKEKNVYYIAGTREMVEAVTDILLANGVTFEQLYFEEFYAAPGNQTKTPELEDAIKAEDPTGMFRLAVEEASDHIMLTDVNGRVVYANAASQKITGYSLSEIIGQTPRLWGGLMGREFYRNLWRTVKTERRPFTATVKNRRKNNEIYYAILHITPLIKDDSLLGFLATEEDITDEVEVIREKSEFMDVAAHQLRTPLGIMRWNLEMLLGGDMGIIPSKMSEPLNEIYESDLRLIQLVNDLLDVARISEYRKIGKPVPTGAVAVIDKVIEAEKPFLTKKKIELKVSKPTAGLSPILVDPEHFFQVMDNLVNNAIKYSRENGLVFVRLDETGGRLVITVADNGIGIEAGDRNLIYSKFYRGENAVKMDPAGTGLGLFVVKSFVEGWGGKVSFTSEAGKGTAFTVEIPVSKEDIKI